MTTRRTRAEELGAAGELPLGVLDAQALLGNGAEAGESLVVQHGLQRGVVASDDQRVEGVRHRQQDAVRDVRCGGVRHLGLVLAATREPLLRPATRSRPALDVSLADLRVDASDAVEQADGVAALADQQDADPPGARACAASPP